MYREIFLAVIVSADIFLVAAAYRSSDIRIPPLSALIINLICTFVLGISLVLSEIAGQVINIEICRIIGFIVLTAMGIITVFKSLMRGLVRQLSKRGELSLRHGGSGIVVKLYLDDTAADFDCSKILSPGEAAALSLASSLDSAATGLSCGYSNIDPVLSAIFVFLAGFAAMFLGSFFGKKISSLDHDLSWLGGIMLIAFAIFEFISN